MKSFTIFLFLYSLNIFLCNEPGGVKVALNQRFIKNMIKSMESEIRKRIDSKKIPGDSTNRPGNRERFDGM